MSAPTLFATDTLRGQLQAVIRLSIPAVLSQISATAMQYIDATMVGSLGANASAAIGLVSSSTWLLSGLCAAETNLSKKKQNTRKILELTIQLKNF